jgi:hypothetical protein
MNKTLVSVLNFLGRNHSKIIISELAVTTAYAAMLIRDGDEYEKFLQKTNALVEYYGPDPE